MHRARQQAGWQNTPSCCPDYGSFDLRRTLADVAVDIARQLTPLGFFLDLSIHPSTPRMVIGMPVLIRRLLLSVSGYSMAYLDMGGLILRAHGEEDTAAGATMPVSVPVRIIITDTGLGVPAARLRTIFEPPHKTPGPKGSNRPLTSLYHAKELARQMGGDLTIATYPDWGTRYTARIMVLRQTEQATI